MSLPDVNPLYVLVAVTFLVATHLVYKLVLYPRYFSPLRHIPGPPLGDPFLGQGPAILATEAGILQRQWVHTYGPVVRAVGPLGIERVMFTSPEAMRKILVEEWLNFPRPAFLRKVLGIVTGYGLLTVTGDEHRLMRKTMNPAFSIQHLQAQVETYNEPIDILIELLKARISMSQDEKGAGTVLPMYEWMSKVTLDIICGSAFGYRTDSLRNPHNPLAEAYEELLSMQTGYNLARFIAFVNIPFFSAYVLSPFGYATRNIWQYLPRTGLLTQLISCMHRIKNISAQILRERIADAMVDAEDVKAKKDIMSLLIRARMAESEKDPGAYKMNDAQMMDQVLTFLGAGHETTASGLAWTLWLLAANPQAQTKLRAELASTLEPETRPDYRTLTKNLPYLDAVVQESLRILPPVPMTFRKSKAAHTIDGVLIPKDTLFYIPIRVYNTWTELWGPDAESFRPERWLETQQRPLPQTMSFIQGPHACIGKTMSIVEMKAVLCALLANFEFETAFEGQTIHPTAAVTMKPADNMPLRIKFRPIHA
ncbi:cytochrome P450 [Exidia glandulosa HHB12029]|uniref:Cytochrome P450 n=1 Tax=Exidia glandulosa HHB12029 TaxID=1314781 RepID=A0A165DHD7_EXIGL|nr:cytochrome P450 [Exidia glandulosa HHB12029]